MRIQRALGVLGIFRCILLKPLASSTGPDDHPITDPKSIVSESKSNARPESFDELYTRMVFGSSMVA